MPVQPPKKSAAQQAADYENLVQFVGHQARSYNNPSVKEPGEYTNSARLGWAESSDGTKYPCGYILNAGAFKIAQDGADIYYIIEGTVLACGSGAVGSLRIKKGEYRPVDLTPNMGGSIMQLYRRQATEGLCKKFFRAFSGMSEVEYDNQGQDYADQLWDNLWKHQSLVGMTFKVDVIPKERSEDEYGRDSTTFPNASIYPLWDPWEDLSVLPEQKGWEGIELIGAPDYEVLQSSNPIPLMTVTKAAPPPVSRPTVPAAKAAPPPVSRPTVPAAKAAPPPVSRPTVPAAKAAPPPVSRPTVPAAKAAPPPVSRPTVPAAKAAPPPVSRPTVPPPRR